MVSGLDPDGHIERSILRFATVDEANDAVLEFTSLGIAGLEPVRPGEEIPCQIRIIVPKELLWVIVAWLLPYLLILFVALRVGSIAPLVGPILLVMFIVLILTRGFWLRRLVRKASSSTNPLFFRNIKGSLAVEEQKLILRPEYYFGSTAPTTIGWKTPTVFLIKVGRAEFQLTFSTSEDAAKAAVLVKTSFPQVQETWIANP